MRARRTVNSNQVFRLSGGNEDNDLWAEMTPAQGYDPEDGVFVISSVWEPTTAERLAIAQGANIKLHVWGRGQPPVLIDITNEELKGASRSE